MIPTISGALTFNATLICSLVVNGTKMNDPRACNAWIQCIDGSPVSGSCATGLFYDRESQKCLSSSSIKCLSSDPCAALPTGFAADPYSCNGYYYCKDEDARSVQHWDEFQFGNAGLHPRFSVLE